MAWTPKVTGDWAADNATGRKMADEVVKQAVLNPAFLGHKMKAMVGNGDWTGVEVGFFYRMSEHLRRGRRGSIANSSPDQSKESCRYDDDRRE